MIKAICSNSSHSIILLRNKETYEMFSAKIFPYKNKDTLASIVREIEILTQLNHPSFLKYIGFSPFDFNNDDCPIIITEYYKNNKLSNIRQKITEWNDTKKLINLYGIACGMKYLHSLNIIHRNLNTSNILLDENFYPKIAGFGSSRMNTYDEGFLSSALYPEFIAPEFFTQKETFNDKALDVYSYAMIAYIIMTEQSPFSAKNNYRIIDQVTRGERPSFNKSIPKIYQTLIENCWDNVSVSRPSFEEIISFIEGNLDQFITENVDKNEFLKYVDYANKKNISVNIKTDTSQRYKRNIPVLSADLKFKVDLEKYSKQSKIGEGSFGRVYKVLENETGNIYACKISKNEMSEITQNEMDEISQREMDNIIDNVINLIREINILSKLNHYCIMKFIGYSLVDFKNNPKPTIITEFFSNGSLDEVIKQERIFCSLPGWDDTKKLINIYGIASGMKYLHSLNILHRDLRPGNILVDENLCPKLADFGLSKEINTDDTNEITFSGIKGTPMYIAPEIWRNCDYRKAGDVYAFAFIVYEIITNEIPYNNYAYFQVMKDIMDGKRPDIHSSVDECYKNLIEKCWANDPKDRLTFEKIVHELKEDKHFIKDTIDSNDFFEYVYFVDQYFADIKSENKKITQLKGKSFQKVDLRDKKIIESKSEKIKEEDLIKVEEIEVEKYGFIELKNYKKQSLIFESDFSKFYKIIDRKSKQIYSAKESKISMKEFSKNDILKLTREVNILSQLNHPSITKFIGYSPVNFKNRPKPTIITEYLLNGSLNQILEKERNNCKIEGWNDTKKLIIIYGVASSMMYLHSHNILHRDLRPSNILLDEYLCPKLSDFGLCTKYHDANTMSFQSTSGIKGQPSYLSPEILSSCKYSKASDVYAFALVVYEIVTNEIPFNSLNFSQIVIEVVTKSTRPQFNKQINESYRNLIEKCWQKDPEDRPSFERIVNELKKNSSFITNSINKDDFNKYIKYIDDYYTTFESSNKVLDFDDFIERNNETFIKVSLNKVENGDNKNRKKHHHRKNQHENDDDN